jgi:hypothetical protein
MLGTGGQMMTIVYCSNTDCVHYDVKSRTCNEEIINVGEEYFCTCSDYASFRDSIEYGNRHYIAVMAYNADGKKVPARLVRYGKRIEYNGITFYTIDRTADDSYHLTHKRTGVDVGNMARLQDHWELFLQKEKEFPDIDSLPLAEYTMGKYKLVEEGADNEQREAENKAD